MMNRLLALVSSDAKAVLQGRSHLLEDLRRQHLFITGGTGFLGTWLLELVKVLNESHGFATKVTVYSRNSHSFAIRYPHLGQLANFRFEEGDIRSLTDLPRDVCYIIHAAALTNRLLISSQPTAVAEVNSVGTQRLLRAAELLEDLRKFVLMSSGLVYGAQPWDKPTIDESFAGSLRCNEVNAVYAESKRFAEVIAHSAISESKIPVVTLRPFAFLGPYQSLQLPWAVTDFIRDSFLGGPIRIMGDGTTIRSLMYASDYAFWVLAALTQGKARETYNVGSPEGIDLAALAKMITQSFSPIPEIRMHVGQTGNERSRLVPDISRAQRDLGVEVTVSLPDAISKTITWNRYLRFS
jgi:nucleoside-diphosphate-sugar epimerase